MTQNSSTLNPFFNPQQFWQACCAPYQAQTAYWQTVQNIVQQRVRTLQHMGETTTTACQGMSQCGNPSDVAAICSAWWGIQTKTLATLNADTQSAQVHLWEQWQQSFPQLDRSVWTQQYTAWQNACEQAKTYTQKVTASALNQAFSATQNVQQAFAQTTGTSQTGTTTAKSGMSFPIFVYSGPKVGVASGSSSPSTTSSSTSSYSQPKGTFIPASGTAMSKVTAQQTYAAGPTAPGTAPRGMATAASNVKADSQTTSSTTSAARTALADNTVPLPKATKATVTQSAGKPFAQQGEFTNLQNSGDETSDNVTSLSARKREAGTSHAGSLTAASSARRSVVARRATKARRVAR